jgi:hypothetical protein
MRTRFKTLSGTVLGLLLAAVSYPGAAAGQQVVRVPAAAANAESAALAKSPNVLRLDDGTAEEVLSLSDPTNARSFQAVFLNRFTPSANQLPFTVQAVSIAFRKTCAAGNTGLRKSMTFQVVVYLDPEGTGNPANATLVTRQDFQVRPRDGGFQRIQLNTPVTVTGGDVWVGYTNSFSATDDRLLYHAALDTTNPKGRSWIFYNIGGSFTGDVLQQAQIRRLIDDEGVPGNWMIRARGRVGQ